MPELSERCPVPGCPWRIPPGRLCFDHRGEVPGQVIVAKPLTRPTPDTDDGSQEDVA